jgi:hypothetical protein
MDAIREQLNRPLVAGLVGLVVGTLFGLVVLGWWLWPVQWVDATPAELRYEDKVEYLRMTIEAYAYTGDTAVALQRYQALGEGADQALTELIQNPGNTPPEAVQNFAAVVVAAQAPGAAPTLPVGTPAAVETPVAGAETPTAVAGAPLEPTQEAGPTGAGSILRSLLTIFCVIALLLAAGLMVLFFLRGRRTTTERMPLSYPSEPAQTPMREAPWTDYTASGEEPPLAQFMSSYRFGDDAFNDSFGIESPNGEYLGECGVEISDTVVVGEPKKVTAFEVWLFDKNDYQTVTKVMMSEHAFSDSNIRQKLAAKGTPVLAALGSQTSLETQTLRMAARVVDMGYGEGILPAESYFDRFVLEVSVWAIRPEQRTSEG